jgi:hypothetical protein
LKHCAKSASSTSRDNTLRRHQAVKRGIFGRTIAAIARTRAKISGEYQLWWGLQFIASSRDRAGWDALPSGRTATVAR